MKTFNEWVSSSDDDVLENQLSQLVDRVAGFLFDLPDEQKEDALEKFINSLKARINENV